MDNNKYHIYIAYSLPKGSKGAYCTYDIWSCSKFNGDVSCYDMEMFYFPHYLFSADNHLVTKGH